jgi:dipeptidyl aminopeptidase/acylaminoacyl peptidase
MSLVRRGRHTIGSMLALVGVAALALGAGESPPGPNARAANPFPQVTLADSLIRPGETHFDWPCDQEYVYDLDSGKHWRVSTGTGRTTCGFFFDHDRLILFSSTHLAGDSCPPPPDYSKGYVWRVDPGYDIFTAEPDGSKLTPLTRTPGYDAETTLSPDGRRLVFTSERDGDLELYTMAPDGRDVRRVTHAVGYDGGAVFSWDGKWLCYRANHPADSASVAEYRDLLAHHLVRPTRMDLWLCRSDGTDARQITALAGASFAPYFAPDGRIIFASNWKEPKGRNFDLYLVTRGGTDLEQVTTEARFDAFPMFTRDGRFLAFSSNRGGSQPGETNVFIAEWR